MVGKPSHVPVVSCTMFQQEEERPIPVRSDDNACPRLAEPNLPMVPRRRIVRHLSPSLSPFPSHPCYCHLIKSTNRPHYCTQPAKQALHDAPPAARHAHIGASLRLPANRHGADPLAFRTRRRRPRSQRVRRRARRAGRPHATRKPSAHQRRAEDQPPGRGQPRALHASESRFDSHEDRLGRGARL